MSHERSKERGKFIKITLGDVTDQGRGIPLQKEWLRL
jgi:hypothetical protein